MMSFVCCCCLSTFDSRRHLCATLTFDPKAVNPQPCLGRTSGASAALLRDPALISPQMFVALQFVASYKFSGPDVGPGRGPALRSATTFRACCATLQEKMRWRRTEESPSSRLLNQRVTVSKRVSRLEFSTWTSVTWIHRPKKRKTFIH